MWTQQAAIELCKQIEEVCPTFGCHVALTGGCLYKDGERKDADFLFYRIRQVPTIDVDGLFLALRDIGITIKTRHGFVTKATYAGNGVDILIPEKLSAPRVVPDSDEPYLAPADEAFDRMPVIAKAVLLGRSFEDLRSITLVPRSFFTTTQTDVPPIPSES